MYYQNFKTVTYAPAGYLNDNSIEQIKEDIEKVAKYIKLDKIYLETYRSEVLIERKKMEEIKALFIKYGYEVSGGITTTVKQTLMGSMCFTDPANRKRLGEIAAYTAELFDELILDDFYFTNCRCENCIKEKGDRSWAEFRLALMNDVSENVIIKNAKAANPKVNCIIKYPNWYDSFQANGYNLEDESKMFDMIYTGTETRDPHFTHQNLPRYLSYFLPRLFENIKPGKNGGGWYDLFECTIEDYLQQAYLTLFSKCREQMLFCFPLLVNYPSYAAAVGAFYDEADLFVGKLGAPQGIACYKPYHSYGERLLHETIGMCGIPLEPYPYYPQSNEAKVIFLTADAAWDKDIVAKIKQSLTEGKKVFVTSGLYEKLAGKGIEDILPVEITNKKITTDTFTVSNFGHNNAGYFKSCGTVTLPHVAYNENDSWPLAVALTPYSSHVLLLSGNYGGSAEWPTVNPSSPARPEGAYAKGKFYILTVPDDRADFYKLPTEVLNLLRKEMDLPVTLECTSRIGLFMYDNNTFILQSFLDRPERVKVCVKKAGVKLAPLVESRQVGKTIFINKTRSGEDESVFEILLMPGRFMAFSVNSEQ